MGRSGRSRNTTGYSGGSGVSSGSRDGSSPEGHSSELRRGCLRTLFVMLFLVALTFFLIFGMLFDPTDESASSESSASRVRLESALDFLDDCVTDELGWIEDPSALAEEIRYFYDITGIQPYIYLKAYDAELTSEEDRQDYAEAWYDANIGNDASFLFVYYAGEDADPASGYMCQVIGSDAASVLDEDALEIFRDNLDSFWNSDLEIDEMFAQLYEETADEIMLGTSLSSVIAQMVSTLAVVLIASVILILWARRRRRS